jgi:phage shock protein PspC (stress-responsive transcriptional regulator)
MNATSEHSSSTTAAPDSGAYIGASPLRRPSSGRMLGGVAAGVARSLGVDPIIVRIAFVVLTLAGGAGVPAYLAGWLLIPDEGSGQSLAGEIVRSLSARRN